MLLIKGLNIRNSIDVHQSYLYCLSDNISDQIQIGRPKDNYNIEFEENTNLVGASGFYVYDLQSIFNG